MHRSRGYTLVEVMIIVAIIGVIAMVLIAVLGRGCASVAELDHDKAVGEARKWGSEMGLEVKGVSCASVDSDGDGYVSCSLSTARKDGSTEIVPIECAASFSINSGCRVARVIPTPGR